MKFNNIVSVCILIGFLSIGTSFMFGILSETDDQINITGTPYEEGYNSNVHIQNSTGNIISVFGILLGGLILFMFIKSFTGSTSKRRVSRKKW